MEVFCIGTEQGQVECWCSPLENGLSHTFYRYREVIGSWTWIPGYLDTLKWSQMWSTLLKSQNPSNVGCTSDSAWLVLRFLHTLDVERRQCAGGGCTRGDLGVWNTGYRGGEGHSGTGVGFRAGWCGMRSLGWREEGGQDLGYRFMSRTEWYNYIFWRHLGFLSQSCW